MKIINKLLSLLEIYSLRCPLCSKKLEQYNYQCIPTFKPEHALYTLETKEIEFYCDHINNLCGNFRISFIKYKNSFLCNEYKIKFKKNNSYYMINTSHNTPFVCIYKILLLNYPSYFDESNKQFVAVDKTIDIFVYKETDGLIPVLSIPFIPIKFENINNDTNYIINRLLNLIPFS